MVLVLAASTAIAQTETIAEIRVHGNHTTPDADILGIAGLKVGDAATEATIAAAARRLEASGRFDDAEVLKRYRSISDPSQILVMLVVDEQAAVAEDDLTPGPLRKLKAASMWMPILSHADGYGFTYGAQMAVLNPIGRHTRLAVPLTWGGERKAAAEIERTFTNGPVDLIRGTFLVNRRVNPHFELADRRFEASVRGERRVLDWLRLGAGARVTDNRFGTGPGAIDDRTTAASADLIVDTRIDPGFPRNAFYAKTGIERMAFTVGDAVRWTTDVRGYIGFGSPVLALRGSLTRSDSALPLFEQTLLGGSGSVRGYRTGHAAGDNVLTLSAELRYPLTPPLVPVARFGLKAFVDAGTAWAHGDRLEDQTFRRGIGGGVYFGAGPMTLDLDVARARDGGYRTHFGLGLTF